MITTYVCFTANRIVSIGNSQRLPTKNVIINECSRTGFSGMDCLCVCVCGLGNGILVKYSNKRIFIVRIGLHTTYMVNGRAQDTFCKYRITNYIFNSAFLTQCTKYILIFSINGIFVAMFKTLNHAVHTRYFDSFNSKIFVLCPFSRSFVPEKLVYFVLYQFVLNLCLAIYWWSFEISDLQ